MEEEKTQWLDVCYFRNLYLPTVLVFDKSVKCFTSVKMMTTTKILGGKEWRKRKYSCQMEVTLENFTISTVLAFYEY